MIKTAATCLGGSGAALIPIHTSSLFRNSCSSRPPSKPSFPTFGVLWSVFPRFKVWPKRRWKKFTLLAGTWLLYPSPFAACDGRHHRQPIRRKISPNPAGSAQTQRHRQLHRCQLFGSGFQSARNRRRRQRHSHHLPAL